MHRSKLRPILTALAAFACAALACADALEEEITPTSSPTSSIQPTSVIVLPTVTTTPPSPTPAPAVIATSVVTPTSVIGSTSTPPPACTNDAEFVTDVTIPDGTSIVPGSTFDKVWQIRNSGTCPWDGTYHLAQTSNTSVQAITKVVALPPVEPGATVNLTVKATLSANAPPGAKSTAVFELRDSADNKFGTKLTIQVVAVLEGTEQGSAAGTVGGVVWKDFCHIGEAGDTTVGGTCILHDGGGKTADGIRQSDEKGIAGVKVEIRRTGCDGVLVNVATTDLKGAYSFTALSPDQYCVSINSLDAGNASILIPGMWTHPFTTDGVTFLTITLEQGKSVLNVNFGWDDQFD